MTYLKALGVGGLALAAAVTGLGMAYSQSTGDLSATETQLVAGEWILKGVKISMGADGCIRGETYFFSRQPQTVRIKQCVDGKWQTQTSAWTLRRKPPTDIEVLINAKPYVVKFGSDHGKTIMILRSREGSSITSKTTEQVFRLSED